MPRFKPFHELSSKSQHDRAAELFGEIDQLIGGLKGKPFKTIIAELDPEKLSAKAQDTLNAMMPCWKMRGWI